MEKPNLTVALATFASSDLRVDAAQLRQLQTGVLDQLTVMRRLRGEEALRGLLVGLTLNRIKASLHGGEFLRWQRDNIVCFSDRYCRYLMQLSLVFVDRCKVAKPELLALPGDQTELAIETKEGAQKRLFEKAVSFIGDLSISELLEKHGLKETKRLGGARDKATAPEASNPVATFEEMYAQSRDEIGGVIERAEALLLRENRLQYLTGRPDEIKGVVEGLRNLADRVEAAAKPLLLAAAKPVQALPVGEAVTLADLT
ncbi:MAG: hypothetical protein RL376_1970 [Verrucomicrobiota bacterium]|jgi:hypothetical protein